MKLIEELQNDWILRSKKKPNEEIYRFYYVKAVN